MDYTIETSIDNAPTLSQWFKESGGLTQWASVNLSNPGTTWITKRGAGKPNWQCADEPEVVVEDPCMVGLVTYKEVKRFHVAIRRTSLGLGLKLTDASSRKVRKAVEKAGDGATYYFDFFAQDAVILAPDGVISLHDWMNQEVSNA